MKTEQTIVLSVFKDGSVTQENKLTFTVDAENEKEWREKILKTLVDVAFQVFGKSWIWRDALKTLPGKYIREAFGDATLTAEPFPV